MASHPRALQRMFTAVYQIRRYSAPADRSIPAAKQKYVPSSGTYPKGFLAGSAFAGVKASNTKYDDLALVVSETPCAATAVFTKNVFQAAPVTFSKGLLAERHEEGIRGVVVNSGCANAVTGRVGLEHASIMATETDKCFPPSKASTDPTGPDTPQTLVMSTGVIGQRLPIDRIAKAIPALHSSLGTSHEHWLRTAQAICTTDTFPKLISRTYTLPSSPNTVYSIAGMTKGAGMIHPNMGTLLGIICTDAKVKPESLHELLRECVTPSFNSISIDGDTSTNDTVVLLANGAAAPSNAPFIISPRTEDSASNQPTSQNSPQAFQEDYTAFRDVLQTFMTDLAKLVVRDGEGATKFVTIRVRSDHGYASAKRVANSIARSSLVKTALYGKDANWGRILCATGYAPGVMDSLELPIDSVDQQSAESSRKVNEGPFVEPGRTSVSFIPSDGSKELKLLIRGEPEEVDEERAKQILELEDLELLVRLEDDGEGTTPASTKPISEAVVYTCDLSHEYVTINGDYRT